VSNGVDDPEKCGAEVAFSALAAALDGSHYFVHVEAIEVVEDADRDVGLGVTHALRGKITKHVVGDGLIIGSGVQALGDGLEAHEEAGKIVVAVDLLRLFKRERRSVVLA
jgi:hypothetical protein